MSYILEGLKKLEEKRKQEERPAHLLSFQGNNPEKPVKKPIWPYLLVAVLLLNAGVFIWWIGPWRSVKMVSPVPQSTAQESRQTAAVSTPAEQKKQSGPISVKESQQTKITSSPETSNTVKVKKQATSSATKDTPAFKQPSTPVVKETQASRQPSVATPAPSDKSKPPANGRIVKLDELPPDIRKDIPDLKVSAHFFSTDHQARFARVNDRILHEGESLSEGLKVDEINASGTVFNYRGYRFQININETR